jgi:hypothetical protein
MLASDVVRHEVSQVYKAANAMQDLELDLLEKAICAANNHCMRYQLQCLTTSRLTESIHHSPPILNLEYSLLTVARHILDPWANNHTPVLTISRTTLNILPSSREELASKHSPNEVMLNGIGI